MTPGGEVALLLVRTVRLTCAFSLEAVSEITRVLPLQVLGGLPEYVLGASVIRGTPTAIVDLSLLLGTEASSAPSRYVVLRTDSPVALAVDEVLGVRRVPTRRLETLPRLMTGSGREHVRSLLSLDGDLVSVMASAIVLPDEVLAALRAERAGAEGATATTGGRPA